MQSIINNSGFGFCKASGFRNCNNCVHRLRCISYAPIYTNNLVQQKNQEVFNLQSRQISDSISSLNNEEILKQENLILKQKIQDLESQILLLNQSKNIENTTKEQIKQAEEQLVGLQVYENKSLDIPQQDEVSLKPKKGIFGTKFVEDKPKKK